MSRILHQKRFDTTHVSIENIDTISAIMASTGSVLVLNMANPDIPGGGYRQGAVAQEEDLFRRTNLFRTLVPELYPMTDNQLIYTPTVHVLRDAHWHNLSEPRTAAFVSIAALYNPKLDDNGKLYRSDYETSYRKIKMIYHLGALYGFDHLILGALGCGAFNNPPQQIADIFANVTEEYDGYFQSIKFAILSSNGNMNHKIFSDRFS
jgi:uncharacterized protein (TIGR02452 family)